MRDAGVSENDAELGEARWYLSREGQQHGPLSDRELSLFADGGNFKPGDLLWTAGLDDWKSADEIFGIAPPEDAETPETQVSEPGVAKTDFALEAEDAATPEDGDGAGSARLSTESAETPIRHHDGFDDDPLFDDPLSGEPLDDHVGALAKAMRGEAEARKLSFQERVIADLKAFGGFCICLWAVFIMLTVHAVVGGAQYGVGMSFFVLTTLNAFLLMQAMPLAERYSLFQNLKHKPLIYSIIFKTLIFVGALVLAYAVEMALLGLVGIGAGVMTVGGGLGGMLAWWVIFSVALLPYFAFREVEGAVGADMMGKLLFGRI